jgi:nicotinamidase-related amidase
MSNLKLNVRYYRHGTDEGVECLEENFGHRERSWSVPVEQSALVLVDCWAEHFIRSHEANSSRIMREVLLPAVQTARGAGVPVIHAPSPTYVQAYPQWVAYASDRELGLESPPPPDAWPPAEFRRREGEYAPFAKPAEPKITEWAKDPSHYRIYEPLGPQPGDFVVATGDQLHRLLKHQQRLHLFYAGFATNICVLYRDYGTRAMAQRGYNVILLRDATMGIEAHDTVEGGWLTHAAIRSLEILTGHTTTAGEFTDACRSATA